MTWHVITRSGSHDHYEPAMGAADSRLIVPFGAPEDEATVHSNIASLWTEFGIAPTEEAAEFLRAAIAAYTADVRIPRRGKLGAYDNWTRDITLHLAVRQSSKWQAARPVLERMLRFLTGDYWRLQVRTAPDAPGSAPSLATPHPANLLTGSTACLFSGGLDSYVGALDQLSRQQQVVLVGHHSAGGGPTSTSQKRSLNLLRTAYNEDRTPFLQFWVSPPKGEGRASEITTRGRSILFLALGVAVASALPGGRLIVPENGLISLNVPLTNARMGSLSTRTTHPHLMKLLRQLLAALHIDVTVELPYRFATKGEILANCAEPTMMQAGLSQTMSCSHPGAGRFLSLRDPNIHCGYCLPCLIRRSAIARALITPDPTRYAFTDLRTLSPTRRADLRSLKLALERYENQPPRLSDLLVAGPLPGSDNELQAYLDLFQRGIDEVRGFVEGL